MCSDIFAARSAWRRCVIDRNPFYLLSAICMLLGCVGLTNSSSWTSIPLNRLLILIATLNVYEAILIGLAIFLLVKRGLRRDANILLIIEAFFFVDVTFLNSEIFTRSIGVGLVVNCILFLLAVGKLAAIFYALGLRIRSGAFAAMLVLMLVLFATPGVFKELALHRNGTLPGLAIYSVWWIIGILIPLMVMLMRNADRFHEQGSRAFWQARMILTLFAVLPVASLIAHISTSNWIYGVGWHWANLSPMLLGIGLASGIGDTSPFTRPSRARRQFWLPVLAIWLSTENPASLFFLLGHWHLSPMRLTALVTMLIYVHGLLMHRRLIFGFGVFACLAIAGLGTSVQEIEDHLELLGRQVYAFVRRSTPTTQTDWGVLSLIAAFGLLVIGAAISLSKAVEPERGEERVT